MTGDVCLWVVGGSGCLVLLRGGGVGVVLLWGLGILVAVCVVVLVFDQGCLGW